MLKSLIIKEIQDKGPMPQDRFMELALTHPEYGYYRVQEAVTKDFTTAPEVSQMFGELIGVWVRDLYQQLGHPPKIDLIELGPGRGTLMADIQRVLPTLSDFLNIYFIEISPVLKEMQSLKVPQAQILSNFHEVPKSNNPMIILANEFFDALPVKCFERKHNKLYERCIGAVEGKLEFQLQHIKANKGPDRIWEENQQSEALMSEICKRLTTQTGAFLCIDYGYREGEGDSLQAIYNGLPSDPLSHIGGSDLTCHIDFGRLKNIALEKGLGVFGPTPQGQFLKKLGIDVRLSILKLKNPSLKVKLELDALRLIHPMQMGTLFKALVVFSPHIKPIGFDPCI